MDVFGIPPDIWRLIFGYIPEHRRCFRLVSHRAKKIFLVEKLDSIQEDIRLLTQNHHLELLKLHAFLNPERYNLKSHTCLTLIVDGAINYGYLDILKWIRAKGWLWTPNLESGKAIKANRVDVFNWLIENGNTWSYSVRVISELGGSEILKVMCKSSDDYFWSYAGAIEGGQLQCLEWLNTVYPVSDTGFCTYACQTGHLDVLKLLRKNGCGWNPTHCLNASIPHPNIRQWILDQLSST